MSVAEKEDSIQKSLIEEVIALRKSQDSKWGPEYIATRHPLDWHWKAALDLGKSLEVIESGIEARQDHEVIATSFRRYVLRSMSYLLAALESFEAEDWQLTPCAIDQEDGNDNEAKDSTLA